MLTLIDVAENNYDTIPAACRHCLYWQTTGAYSEGTVTPHMENEKLAWWRKVSREFGNCHKVVMSDGIPVGFIQFAPAKFFARAQTYTARAPTEDAVFIACLYLSKDVRGKGLGILTLKELIAALRKKEYLAIETFTRANSTDNPSGPADLYLRQGFKVKHEKDGSSLLRLDL